MVKILKGGVQTDVPDFGSVLADKEVQTLGDRVPYKVPAGTIPQEVLVKNQLRITTTPDILKAKWLYDYLHSPLKKKELLEDEGVTIKSVHSSLRDFPYASKEYIAQLESSYDEHFAKQEIDGQWVVMPAGRPVYGTSFNSEIHVREVKYNPNKPLMIGKDFGYHYPAVLFAQEDDFGRVLILGELLGKDQQLEHFCDDVWAFITKNYISDASNPLLREQLDITVYHDPQGKALTDLGTSVRVLKNKGFIKTKFRNISKKEGLEPSLDCVRRQLTKLTKGIPNLIFNENHTLLTVEGMVGGYYYDEPEDDLTNPKEKPNNSTIYVHLMDALRYLMVNIRYVNVKWDRQKRKPKFVKPRDPVTGY